MNFLLCSWYSMNAILYNFFQNISIFLHDVAIFLHDIAMTSCQRIRKWPVKDPLFHLIGHHINGASAGNLLSCSKKSKKLALIKKLQPSIIWKTWENPNMGSFIITLVQEEITKLGLCGLHWRRELCWACPVMPSYCSLAWSSKLGWQAWPQA